MTGVNFSREAARFLVSLGADLHARDQAGMSPLARAAEEGHYELARYLQLLGARP